VPIPTVVDKGEEKWFKENTLILETQAARPMGSFFGHFFSQALDNHHVSGYPAGTSLTPECSVSGKKESHCMVLVKQEHIA
jgi:hypothetical protein